jgi:hypothetical protein
MRLPHDPKASTNIPKIFFHGPSAAICVCARVRVSSFPDGRVHGKVARKRSASGPASHGAEGKDSGVPYLALLDLDRHQI